MPDSPAIIDYSKEVRFAVVMYGGVSLAIYINGVAQELYRIVRATAPRGTDGRPLGFSELTGTEKVYRKLSHLVWDPKVLEDYRNHLSSKEGDRSQKLAYRPAENSDAGDDETLKGVFEQNPPTRFIVDILSGTSAGGINAIYLAKAFANDQQIDQLKDLWVNEGDIALLLNDKRSVMGMHLRNQDKPQSLLNSRRMYFKLLKSLDDMSAKKPSQDRFKSPYVDEMDLFITATDIEGVPVALRLSDAVVYERRHRNVFHFKYDKAEVLGEGEDINDFKDENNAFLAFAARCTSSFPFAFEPMRLRDIDEVLNLFGKYRNRDKEEGSVSETQGWQRFFLEELDPETGAPVRPPRFGNRSFGDGGYLDNKPFSYATETLMRRQSDVLVDRKLVYIEPSPDHPEDNPARLEKPNALQNVKAALLELPSYETIREDLQRVLDRNKLIERVKRIIIGIERDVNSVIPYRVKEYLKDPRHKVAAPAGTGSGITSVPVAGGPGLTTNGSEILDVTTGTGTGTGTSGPSGTGSTGGERIGESEDTSSLRTSFAETDPTVPEKLAKKRRLPAWAKQDLTEMVIERDRYFLPYRRLRISSVTDELAKLVARLANFDENSDQVLALRYLVRAWRDEVYKDYKTEGKDTVNAFLWSFDLGYRLRRLSFTRGKVDELSLFRPELLEELRRYAKDLAEINEIVEAKAREKQKKGDDRDLAEIVREKRKEIRDNVSQIMLLEFGSEFGMYVSGQEDEVREVLHFIKCELNEIFRRLRLKGRLLRKRHSNGDATLAAGDGKNEAKDELVNPLLENIKRIEITPRDLDYLLAGPAAFDSDSKNSNVIIEEQDEEICVMRAQALLGLLDDEHRAKLTAKEPLPNFEKSAAERVWIPFISAAAVLQDQLETEFERSRNTTSPLFDLSNDPPSTYSPISERGKALIGRNPDLLSSELSHAVRRLVGFYYHSFDDYDQIRFPILYETDVGEADIVEVIRISPEDATSLLNERQEFKNSSEPGKARKKLAGVSLHHFGAFLDRNWRQNDIMWGRLDGAERLIAAMLPGTSNKIVRQKLTREAHLAILKEEMKPQSLRGLENVMGEALLRASTGLPINEAIDKTLEPLSGATVKTRLEEIVRSTLQKDEELLDFMGKAYEVNRQLEPKLMLNSMSRASQIIGKMFENLADESGWEGKRLAWIARLGKIFWGLVEVAVPSSLLNLLLFHWLKILYLFEFLIIAGSILFNSKEVQNFGWKALGVTLGINIIVLLLRDYMRLKHRWRNFFVFVFAASVVTLSAIGVRVLYAVGFKQIFKEIYWFGQNLWARLFG